MVYLTFSRVLPTEDTPRNPELSLSIIITQTKRRRTPLRLRLIFLYSRTSGVLFTIEKTLSLVVLPKENTYFPFELLPATGGIVSLGEGVGVHV